MKVERISPSGDIAKFVAWYWCAESDALAPHREKIIPDGYPEFIFHYGHPYRICLNRRWRKQGLSLAAGQLRRFFFLENTGPSGIFGITFNPTALTHLFGVFMLPLTDKVLALDQLKHVAPLGSIIKVCENNHERIAATERYLLKYMTVNPDNHPVDTVVASMRANKGMQSIQAHCDEVRLTDRQLQRLFNKYVGLTPKYYARIIRFNSIFAQIKEGRTCWADVVHHSGYYDQSHFIRDFKAFTGDDPSKYPFKDLSLTNFFTKKSNSTGKSDLYNTSNSSFM